ncbi:histidine kinase [Dactylosporangium sp. NPDC005555]|uniref:sensor histidine kinase n=1 Tax=Dactylosporangium sp. NPDC005555 TaxID=3154889 RepID=UPI0033BDFB91
MRMGAGSGGRAARVLGRWHALPVVARDGVLAGALLAVALLPPLTRYSTGVGELPVRPADALAVVAVAAQCLPLAVRRRLPALCLLVVEAGFAVQQLRGYSTFAGQALLIALYSAGAYAGGRVDAARARRRLAVVATAGYAALAAGLAAAGSAEGWFGFTTFYVTLCACWAGGAWMRRQRQLEAERRERTAVETLAEERARLARELHDVVTHHVTAMVVQADAAKFLLDPASHEVAAGLDAISDTGRHALSELRHLLGVLDPAGRPTTDDRRPVPGGIRDLVERTRAAGQPVDLEESGTARPVRGGPELAAYRLVQEGLTNALKHAPGRPTRVDVRYGTATIEVCVSTESVPAPRVPSTVDGGRGLTGLRERLAVFGGELTAGAHAGRFVVRGTIPLGDGD